MNIIKITNDLVKKRIDKIISENYKNLTRTKIQEYIKKGSLIKDNIIFNNTSYKVKLNDIFIFNIPSNEKKKLQTNKIPINIVYEDNDLILINKQANLTVHPNSINDNNTLVNSLIEKYKNNLSKIGGEFRPGIVHRLDKDTTGLMIIAKNNESHLKLKYQLQNKILKRKYIGFVWGVVNPKNGKIETYIKRSKNNPFKMEISDRNNGRYSLTNYKTIKTFLNDSISIIEFQLNTGRTHQIRIHCNYINHPIIGDKVYGGKKYHLKNEFTSIKNITEDFSRQALHSYKIEFNHPTTNEKLKFEIDLPNDMKNLLNELKKFKK